MIVCAKNKKRPRYRDRNYGGKFAASPGRGAGAVTMGMV